MKKIFLMAVMAVAVLSANAQAFLSGDFSFNNTKIKGIDGSTTIFGTQVGVGMYVSEKFAVGIDLGYGYSNDGLGDTFPAFDDTKLSVNHYTIAPFVNYDFYRNGDFYFFLEGCVEYTFSHLQGVKDNANMINVGISPGIMYMLTDKVGIYAYMGNIGYIHQWMKSEGETMSVDRFQFELTRDLSFGLEIMF